MPKSKGKGIQCFYALCSLLPTNLVTMTGNLYVHPLPPQSCVLCILDRPQQILPSAVTLPVWWLHLIFPPNWNPTPQSPVNLLIIVSACFRFYFHVSVRARKTVPLSLSTDSNSWSGNAVLHSQFKLPSPWIHL